MTAREAVAEALKSTGKTQREVAHIIGLTEKQLSDRLSRGSLKADIFLELLDGIGVDVSITNRASGKKITARVPGVGRRIKQMVNGVIYDTAESDAIANNFYADGENEYSNGYAIELYVDKNGQYFFAEYSSYDRVKDRISPISAADAADFVEKYGTVLHKEPKEE